MSSQKRLRHRACDYCQEYFLPKESARKYCCKECYWDCKRERARRQWQVDAAGRVCCQCRTYRPADQFNVRKNARLGTEELQSHCKACQAERVRVPDDQRVIGTERPCEGCGATIVRTGFKKKYCDDCLAHRQATVWETARRARFYGITVEELESLRSLHAGRCAICGGHRGTKALCVDHCHATGQVRGLLCNPCNRGIGFFEDNLEYLQRAIDYLQQHVEAAA